MFLIFIKTKWTILNCISKELLLDKKKEYPYGPSHIHIACVDYLNVFAFGIVCVYWRYIYWIFLARNQTNKSRINDTQLFYAQRVLVYYELKLLIWQWRDFYFMNEPNCVCERERTSVCIEFLGMKMSRVSWFYLASVLDLRMAKCVRHAL